MTIRDILAVIGAMIVILLCASPVWYPLLMIWLYFGRRTK